MKRIMWMVLFSTLLTAGTSHAEVTLVEVTLDRTEAIYSTGESAIFTIKCYDNNGNIIIADADINVEITQNYDNPACFQLPAKKENRIIVTGTEPGFAMVTAEFNGKKSSAGAGFSPEKIFVDIQEPADFDEFWLNSMLEAEKIPLDPQMEKLPEYSNSEYTAYRISFANINNTRIYGFLTVPVKSGRYPVFFSVPGAGPNDRRPLNMHNDRVITLVMNVFPFPLPKERKDAEELIEKNYPNWNGYYVFNGENIQNDFFFFRAIIGINRALNYVASLPEYNGNNLVFYGSSQGGAMGTALSALNKNITATVLNVPSEFGKILMRAQNPDIQKMSSYFSALNFAKRINVPYMVSAGMVDTSCTPYAISRFFNHVKSEKDIHFIPGMGHDFDPRYQELTAEFIDTHLEE